MKEIESKFTRVHGKKSTGGIDPTPSRTRFAGGTADPEAWRGSGAILDNGGGRSRAGARGWMGKNEPFFPTPCPKYLSRNRPVGVSGTYPGVSGPPESPGCKPQSLRPPIDKITFMVEKDMSFKMSMFEDEIGLGWTHCHCVVQNAHVCKHANKIK
jgi:hypothetical protein